MAGTDSAADGAPPGDETVAGGFPAGFWDSSNIPAATGSMMFKFLNRTNGKYSDSEVYWRFQNTKLNVNETHSLADKPTYDMPAPAAGGVRLDARQRKRPPAPIKGSMASGAESNPHQFAPRPTRRGPLGRARRQRPAALPA